MSNIENITLLKTKKLVRDHFPGIMPPLMKMASRTIFFKEERSYLLNGKRFQCSEIPSSALVSQPRGGTQICERLISEIYQKIGGNPLKVGRFLFWYDADLTRKLTDPSWFSQHAEKEGYFYGNIGPFKEGDVEKLPPLKYIVMSRDPRDALVSHYYSVKDAHVINSKRMQDHVNQAKNLSVDEYVLDDYMQQEIVKFLTQTLTMIRSDLDCLYLRYEDMVRDPRTFVSSIVSYLNASVGEEIIEGIVEKAFGGETVVVEENNLRHRRSGKWGQFRDKLEPDTQNILWKRLESLMLPLGYDKEEVNNI